MFLNKPKDPPDPKNAKRKRQKPTGFEEWGGYMESKKMKLNAQFDEQKRVQQDNDIESQIFKGIAIFVNGYTKPPADELKKLMISHGGKYHHYYSTTKTTHVIASNLPHSKMKTLKTQTVVTADWVSDSIKAGKLLPHQDYLLYTPEQVDKQHRLHFEKVHKERSETPPTSHQQPEELKRPPAVSETCSLSESNSQKNESPLKCSASPNTTSPKRNKVPLNVSITPSKNVVAMTARHPDFLSEFYSNSRLHHISTAGQELKLYVQQLAEKNKEKYFPSRDKLRDLSLQKLPLMDTLEKLSCSKERAKKDVIMHLDMDCFFVSVGLKKHPELRGLPVAVTHAKGKQGGPQKGSDIHYEVAHYANESKTKIGGVVAANQSSSNQHVPSGNQPKIPIHSKEYGSLSEIASCSYEARKAGLRNGMFLGEALRRCPNLQTIPYDFEGYSEVSKLLFSIVASYTLDIEAVSCDELYIDCKDLLQDIQTSPMHFAAVLRSEIEQKTGCTASAGIGSNMLIARLATKVAKPNGQHYVYDHEIENFMKTHKVRNLPGVGYSTSKKLESLGVTTCNDLQSWSLEKLQKEFGPKIGQSLFNHCRGKDNRTVQLQKDRKSVSAEINYGIRFETEADVYKFLNDLSVEVQNRLQSIGSKGKSLTLKLMVRKIDAPIETAKFMGHGVCDHLSKSITLKSATDSSKVIADECCAIARSLKIKPQDYRGVGIQMSKLEQQQKDVKFPKIMENFLSHNNEAVSTNITIDNSKKKSVAESASIVNKFSVKSSKSCLSDDHVSPRKQEKTSDYLKRGPSPSFLAALPEDIREEVLKSYHPAPIAELAYPGPSCSKAPQSSHWDFDQDQNEQNIISEGVLMDFPEAKKREILESYRALLETDTPSTSNYSPQPPTLVYTEEPNSTKGSYVIVVTASNEVKRLWSDNPEIEYPCCIQLNKKKKANLGGAFEIEEIRSLLREWVNSTEDPFDDDVDDLNTFFLEAIEEKSLYKVEMILKYFYRLATTTTNKWKEVYLTSLSNVQKKMKELYKHTLDAYEDFSAL